MTTTDIRTYTMRCERSPDCRHAICRQCGDPLRKWNTRIADHPGTRQEVRENKCYRCGKDYNSLTPADLLDQRHIILTDKELAHVKQQSAHMHAWTMRRRRRLQLGDTK